MKCDCDMCILYFRLNVIVACISWILYYMCLWHACVSHILCSNVIVTCVSYILWYMDCGMRFLNFVLYVILWHAFLRRILCYMWHCAVSLICDCDMHIAYYVMCDTVPYTKSCDYVTFIWPILYVILWHVYLIMFHVILWRWRRWIKLQ